MTAPFARTRIVLIGTSHPGNIGAVARAMKTMGLSRLYLVAPEEYPSEVAVARASGADDVLEAAVVVDTLEQAVADCSLVIGASARSRSLPWPVHPPRESAALAWSHQEKGEVAMVFGRERSGLTNEELHRCHYHVHIPANPDYSSLNLAMAVQVLAWELRMQYLGSLEKRLDQAHLGSMSSPLDPGWDHPPASAGDLERFLEHLEETLVQVEFHDPERPRQLMTRLRRLFQRAHPDRMEVNILRGVLSSIQKRIGNG